MKVIRSIYDFFRDIVPGLFKYVETAIPDLETAAEWIRWVVLGVGLAFTAFVLIFSIIGIFKGRFFRRLCRGCLIFETLGAAGLVLISLRLRDGFLDNTVNALKVGAENVFDLIAGIWDGFGSEDKMLVSFIVIAALFVIFAVIFHLVIVFSKKLERKAEAKRSAPTNQPEPIPAEEEPAPAKKPAAPVAPILDCEMETVDEADNTPVASPVPPVEAAAEESEAPAEDAEAPAAEESAAEPAAEEAEAPAEEAEAAETAEEPAEETAAEAEPEPEAEPKPAFQPIPGPIYDLTDFTDPRRDGFTPIPGATAEEAEGKIAPEKVEDLTAYVYEGVRGEVADVALDLLEKNFLPNSYVDAKVLKKKGLIPESAVSIRVVADGSVSKPLMVKASAFDGQSAAMIILACGRPVLVQ